MPLTVPLPPLGLVIFLVIRAARNAGRSLRVDGSAESDCRKNYT
jgi:hypothetical protein